VASEDLLARISDLTQRRTDPVKCGEMKLWFKAIKDKSWQEPRAFAYWANDEGYFAVSTLYITAIYFHYAGAIRRDFPFIELVGGDETALLSRLSDVRLSIGGKFGVRNYRQFCELIMSETDSAWLNRLVDFYRDLHLKLDDHLGNIEDSLKQLIAFLNTNLRIPASRYSLTEASIASLRRRAVPADMVDQLAILVGQAPMKEVDFVDALVRCIGRDWTDDYKPSILKCADRVIS
jgi:hypothetical protein